MNLFKIRINVHHYFHWFGVKPPKAKRLFLCLRTDPMHGHNNCQEPTTMITLASGKSAILDLVAKTASGAPAKVDTTPPPQYTTSDAAVASLTPSPDNLSVVVTWTGPGTASVGARADGDLRPGS
jgi:hypothetical protein